MRQTKRKLLAIPADLFFMQRDIALLRNSFEIRTVNGRSRPPGPLGKAVTASKILIGTARTDITFAWFAGWPALLAVLFSRLLRKRSLVVVGGYEVARIPEARYGAMLSPVWSRVTRFVLEYADRILTVDDALKKEAIENARVSGHNIKTVPTCYDCRIWQRDGPKDNLVVTVASVSRNTIALKGLETFAKAAGALPDVRFQVIGPHFDSSVAQLKAAAPPNLEFVGAVPNTDLPHWYSRARVYCQLSLHEGLPNALCEAMLCECVPVGTRSGGTPSGIGDTGFYVPYGDVAATVDAIRQALISDHGMAARKRIETLFPIERRQRELLAEIIDLLRDKPGRRRVPGAKARRDKQHEYQV